MAQRRPMDIVSLVFFNILSFTDEKGLYIDVAVSYKKCYTYDGIRRKEDMFYQIDDFLDGIRVRERDFGIRQSLIVVRG